MIQCIRHLGPAARNQLGTPGGAKSFLIRSQTFQTMSNSLKLFPTHYSRGVKKFLGGLRPPWLRAWLSASCFTKITQRIYYACDNQLTYRFSALQKQLRWCVNCLGLELLFYCACSCSYDADFFAIISKFCLRSVWCLYSFIFSLWTAIKRTNS